MTQYRRPDAKIEHVKASFERISNELAYTEQVAQAARGDEKKAADALCVILRRNLRWYRRALERFDRGGTSLTGKNAYAPRPA